MGRDTKIQWAHHTFNPWRGCTKVSDGCKFCYADVQSKRNPRVLGVWGPKGTRPIAAEAYWKQPFQWNRWARDGVCYSCAGDGEHDGGDGTITCEVCRGAGSLPPYRARVFCASLADVFEGADTMPADAVKPVSDARIRLFLTIDATPQLDWLLVTKRPENILPMWPRPARRPDLTPMQTKRLNVWLITSVEDQPSADKRIPELLLCRDLAAVLGLSIEPLLKPIDFSDNLSRYRQIGLDLLPMLDWAIVGGESGEKARQCQMDWISSIVVQMTLAHVPVFVKQLGSNCVDVACECGDFRHQHPGDGACAVCGHSSRPADGCQQFRRTGHFERVRLFDKKGGDIDAWPEALRIRELPK